MPHTSTPMHHQVTGIVKSMEFASDGGGGRGAGKNKTKCVYLLYLDALYVRNTKGDACAGYLGEAAGGGRMNSGTDTSLGTVSGDMKLNLSMLDLEAIQDLAYAGN